MVLSRPFAGILQPPMMCTPTPDGDVARRRAEEDEEGFTGSFSKKTPPKKTAVSHRWNHYTFKSVLATRLVHEGGFDVQRLDDGAFRFTNPHGVAIRPPTRPETSSPDTIIVQNDSLGLAIDCRDRDRALAR